MIKPGRAHRRILYTSLSLLWLSGAIYLIDRFLLGELFSLFASRNELQMLMIKVHSLIGLIFIFIFGTLAAHIQRAWPLKRKRLSGILVSSSITILILTAWLLYYLTSDQSRIVSIYLHSILGLVLPLILGWHIYSLKK